MINYSEEETKKYINAMYEKAKNTEDPIRRIIKLHALDVLYGNNGRDDLNYVDALYPAVEALFTTDVCIESIEKKTVLKAYYEENYSCEEIDYDLYFKLLKYKIINDEDLSKYLTVDEGIENRIKNSKDSRAIDEMKNGGFGYHSIWGNLPRFIRKSAEKRAKANADGGQ